ncbi:MAG TPA: hypothetical protein VE693_01010 [Gaiellaceae bacterium]|jgi:acetate kinase|nr:hypothetical protein [Gaiellaceae bacterium]
MAVSLGGIGALVFTGGVGEHSFWVREHVCALAFLGVALDGNASIRLHGGGNIAAGDSTVRVIVVESREDLVMPRAARRSPFGRSLRVDAGHGATPNANLARCSERL